MPTLQFKGKNITWNHHMSVPYHTLNPVKDLDFQPEQSDSNLIVEGDNLVALKALLPQYRSEIKCIYIDPPYNTGKEHWVYNDATNSPMINEWLNKEVAKEDLTKHDKWLCMMTPRIKMLYELLREDGVIVIHIDEHEISSLSALLIEIFGEENEVGTIVWDKGNPKGDSKTIAVQHEYIVLFAKNIDTFKASNELKRPKKNATKILNKAKQLFKKLGKVELPEELKETISKYNIPESCIEEFKQPCTLEDINAQFNSWLKKQDFSNGEKAYKFIDNDGKVYQSVSMAWPNKKQAPEEYFIPLLHPITKQTCSIPDRGWRNPPKTMKELLDKNLILFGVDETIQPRRKYLLEENMDENIPSVMFYGGSDDAIFKKLGVEFDNPKPYQFSKELLSYFTDKDSIILDSFAGSGTTAHAIMELNKEDEGNRQYILVQMPENSEKEPDKNICRDITRERIVRVIDMYGFESGFEYVRVGQALDTETLLEGELPPYETFAKYVYYLAMGEHLEDDKKIVQESYFVGTKNNQDLYLIYDENMEALQSLALNYEKAESFKVRSREKKVIVYAPACFLDEEDLQEMKIEFVSIPYNLFSKNQEV